MNVLNIMQPFSRMYMWHPQKELFRDWGCIWVFLNSQTIPYYVMSQICGLWYAELFLCPTEWSISWENMLKLRVKNRRPLARGIWTLTEHPIKLLNMKVLKAFHINMTNPLKIPMRPIQAGILTKFQ